MNGQSSEIKTSFLAKQTLRNFASGQLITRDGVNEERPCDGGRENGKQNDGVGKHGEGNEVFFDGTSESLMNNEESVKVNKLKQK